MEQYFIESSVYLLGLEALFKFAELFFMHAHAQVLKRSSWRRNVEGRMCAFRFYREAGRPSDAVRVNQMCSSVVFSSCLLVPFFFIFFRPSRSFLCSKNVLLLNALIPRWSVVTLYVCNRCFVLDYGKLFRAIPLLYIVMLQY